MRYFLNRPLLGVDEIAGFLPVLVVFWGSAYTFQRGGHIRVDLMPSHLPGPVRAWLVTPTEAAALGVSMSLLLAVTIGRLTWPGLVRAFHETVRTTSMIMLIIISESIFSNVIALLGTPRALLGLVRDIAVGSTPFVLILILLVVILFFVPDLALWLPRQMMPGPR